MPARIDPFVDVLLREQGDQLYLLPDEPVTMVKDGKPRKVSRQPLTDQHIYALLVEVAPSESANHIDQMTETEFEYIADRGMVRVPRRKRPPLRQRSGRPPTVTRGPPPHLRHARRSRPRLPRHPWSRRRAPPPAAPPRPRACPPTSPRSTRGPNGPWGSCSKRWCSRPRRTCTCAWASRRCSARTGR